MHGIATAIGTPPLTQRRSGTRVPCCGCMSTCGERLRPQPPFGALPLLSRYSRAMAPEWPLYRPCLCSRPIGRCGRASCG